MDEGRSGFGSLRRSLYNRRLAISMAVRCAHGGSAGVAQGKG